MCWMVLFRCLIFEADMREEADEALLVIVVCLKFVKGLYIP